jgi:hypothetical protein
LNQRKNTKPETTEEVFFAVKRRKSVPHEFVLEALAEVEPRTNPMFGCLAVYVGKKIVMILRDKKADESRKKTSWARDVRKRDRRERPDVQVTRDNGVWLATTIEHHESLRREFPNMRSVAVFGKKVTEWQVLPADALDFESAALRACEMVVAGDGRIGKVPKKKLGL